MRCEEAISVVFSGVTKPRMMARPASISSAAINMSTSPCEGDSAKTGKPAGVGAHLDVVDRRAGALGDARDRGRLREVAVALGDIDDPVGEHAAALPADRQDGEFYHAAVAGLSIAA